MPGSYSNAIYTDCGDDKDTKAFYQPRTHTNVRRRERLQLTDGMEVQGKYYCTTPPGLLTATMHCMYMQLMGEGERETLAHRWWEGQGN